MDHGVFSALPAIALPGPEIAGIFVIQRANSKLDIVPQE